MLQHTSISYIHDEFNSTLFCVVAIVLLHMPSIACVLHSHLVRGEVVRQVSPPRGTFTP